MELKLTVGQPVSAMDIWGELLSREAGSTFVSWKKLAVQAAAWLIDTLANQGCTLDICTRQKRV
jgi:hypothetical protein